MRTTLRGWARRRPALGYVALTFAISWGGILVVVGPTGVLASTAEFESLRWVPPLLLGPSVAGLVMTALAGGRAGLRDLGARLGRWHVGARWYAIALLTAPAYVALASLALAWTSADYAPAFATPPDPVALVIRGLVVAVAAGLFEELGWSGFAVPVLRRRHGAVVTGLIVGLVWGAWHVLPKLLGARAVGTLDHLTVDLLSAIVGLTGFRILMVWVHDRTRSLLLAVLMHTALTASMMILEPSVTGGALARLEVVLAVAPWLIVAAVVLGRQPDLLRRHPVTCYAVMTFAISWGGLLAVAGPNILGTAAEFERWFPVALVLVALGPTVAGLVMTWRVTGRPGLRALRGRLLHARVRLRWYAAALLTAPLYFLAVGLVLGALAPDLRPGIVTTDDPLGVLLRGLAAALIAGIVEELGWTGFATPALRRHHGPVATGLRVGMMWGAWHILPKIWGAAAHGVVADLPLDLLSAVVGLTGFRILMVWVYDATRSLLIAILMHLGLTASTLILQPFVTGRPLVEVGVLLAAMPWVLVAVIAGAKAAGARRRGGPRAG